MASLFRKVNRKLWETSDVAGWLPSGQFPSRVYNDLGLKKNDISCFRLDGSDDTLHRIVAALACASGKRLQDYISFRILNEQEILANGFIVESSKANTADDGVNALHVDVIALSGQAAHDFCVVIQAAEMTEGRFEIDEVLSLIRTSHENKYIKKIPPDIATQIAEVLPDRIS